MIQKVVAGAKHVKIFFYFIIFCFHFFGCIKREEAFRFIFCDHSIISNTEVNNQKEGEYYLICEYSDRNIRLNNNLPHEIEKGKWYIGWGNGENYYNAGVENLAFIQSADFEYNRIAFGDIIKGSILPKVGDAIVFLNAEPGNFVQLSEENCISTHRWRGFPTLSSGFSNIVFDSTLMRWIMIINSTEGIHYNYLAASLNLVDWKPAMDSLFLDTSLFEGIEWAGYNQAGLKCGSALITQVLRHNNLWYIFFDSWDKNGERNIGLITKENLMDKAAFIHLEPIIKNGLNNMWDNNSCSFAKVIKYNNCFIMFYDGRNHRGIENVGMAVSNDLVHWKKSENNPVISNHKGWRSANYTSEPVYVSHSNDSIFLVVTGAKGWNENIMCRFLKRDCYTRQKGNVDDIQWGVFLSTDAGNTFTAHPHNPVFINDYGHNHENGHLGASMEYIKTDSLEYLFYQVKTDYIKSNYGIRVRVRKR